MIIKELEEFRINRQKIRAYLCYIFTRNFPNYLDSINLEILELGFENISHEILRYDAFYILDKNGYQIKSQSRLNGMDAGDGVNRSLRSYYYNAVKQKSCYLTEPYPSSLNGELCVTISMPIYDINKELLYVVCADISLVDILRLLGKNSMFSWFGKLSRLSYATLALSLFCVAIILFYLGIKSLIFNSLHLINATQMFESTILLTLSLAILDLVKAFFEEEVLGVSSNKEKGVSKTMVKFIASIIIALAIESLMLVFKFAMTSPSEIIYAVYLIIAVAILIVGLSFYIYMSRKL